MPTKAQRASSSYSRHKPMAEVSVILDNGRSREIVVPTRVGRLLDAQGIALPCGEEEAFDAIHALEASVCFTMLAEMVSRRDHGEEEAADKLRCYGFRDIEIEQAVDRAREFRFLDDTRFVSTFIDERKRRGWGRRKIELELKRRGIEAADIEGYPEAFFDDEDDLARARAVLERKSVPAARGFEKLVRHLLSKGFSYAIASQAVRERMDDDA